MQSYVPVEMNEVLAQGCTHLCTPRADKRQPSMGDTLFAPLVNRFLLKIEQLSAQPYQGLKSLNFLPVS